MESETSSKCFEFSLLCLNKIMLLLLMILLFCWCLVTLCFQAKTEWWWYTFCYTRNYWTKQKQKAVISSWKSVRSTYKKDHFLSTRIGNQKFPVRISCVIFCSGGKFQITLHSNRQNAILIGSFERYANLNWHFLGLISYFLSAMLPRWLGL